MTEQNREITRGDLEGSITFCVPNERGEHENIMRIEKGTFYWKGEPVEDKYEIYERFNEWMKRVE